jgi:hypothetical protein
MKKPAIGGNAVQLRLNGIFILSQGIVNNSKGC